MTVFLVVGTLELAIRANADFLIESDLGHFIPLSVLKKAAQRDGGFTKDNTFGDGPYFHYLPNTTFANKPNVRIDNHGFRNAVDYPDGANVDIVIVGDSVGIALDAERDIGDVFRDWGYSAINLSIGSHGPLQYLESLLRYIEGRRLRPKVIVVSITMANDIANALKYAQDLESGSTFFDSLKPKQRAFTKEFGDSSGDMFRHVYSVRFIYNLLNWHLTHGLKSRRDMLKNIELKENDLTKTIFENNEIIQIDVPYPFKKLSKNVRVFNLIYSYYLKPSESPSEVFSKNYLVSGVLVPILLNTMPWLAFDLAIQEIKSVANQLNAKVIFTTVPTNMFLPYMKGFPNILKSYKYFHERMINNIAESIKDPVAVFVDGTAAFTEAAGQFRINNSPPDYHLSTRGVEVMATYLRPYIEEILGPPGP